MGKILVWACLAALLATGCVTPSPSPSVPPSSISRPASTAPPGGPTQGDGQVPIQFHVKVPDWTPPEDRVFLYIDERYFAPDGGMAMAKVATNEWQATYRAPEGTSLHYRYNRNDLGVVTHEAFVPDDPTAARILRVGRDGQAVRDEAAAWRWLPAVAPTAQVPTADPIVGRQEPFLVVLDLLDYYQPRFGPLVNSTLDRIAGLGVRNVLVPVQARTILSGDPLQFTDEPLNTFSRTQARAVVEAARERGLMAQIQLGFAADPNRLQEIDAALYAPHDDRWFQRLVEEWETTLRDWAGWAESEGISLILVSNQWPFWGRPTDDQVPRLDAWIGAAVRNISAVFSGKLAIDLYDDSKPFNYYAEFDWLGDKWTFPLASSNVTEAAALRQSARDLIESRFRPIHERYGKPIFLPHVTYASYDGAAGGYRLPGEGSVVAEDRPDDPRFPFDFQEQVDVHHAVLAEAAATPWIVGASQFSYPYWDSVDKEFSVRAKPAERVWANWAAAAEPG